MTSCTSTSGGKKDACSCILDKIRKKYSYKEIVDIEAKIQKGIPTPDFHSFMDKARKGCAGTK